MSRSRPRLGLLFALLLVLAAAPRVDGACNETCRRDIDRCLATQCAGVGRAACRRRCKPAAIQTLAYVLSECRTDAAGREVGRQELRIRRGDQEPITVAAFDVSEKNLEPLRRVFPVAASPPCATFGITRWGGFSVVSYPLQRLGVSPDGSGVVFEVNDEFLTSPSLSPEQNGMFFVRSDGRGLRRLGPPSHEVSHRQNEKAIGGTFTFSPPMFFSPNGRRVAFTDIGPGPSGPAVQIVVLDLATDTRTQVTHLPSGTAPSNFFGEFFLTCCPVFVDDDTVVFQTFVDPDGSNPDHRLAAFSVRIDGSGLKAVPTPIAATGSEVVPSFGVFGGGRTNLLRLPLPGIPVSPPTTPDANLLIAEVFLRAGKGLVQLTNLRRADTFTGFLNAPRTHAFFLASADPFGENPAGNCEIFSVDRFGRRLRQVTHFMRPTGRVFTIPGCFVPGSAISPGCGIGYGY